MMNTPDKNRISAVSLSNVEDSPVFQYINDLSPIEPVKRARAGNIFHSLASSSPSSLFSSPLINPCRDSRFSIKRHRFLDLSSPLILLDETVKISPDTNQFKEQISVAIEFANTLKTRKDGCDIEMVSCENDIGRVGSKYQSDELCRQLNELDADSEAEIVSSDGIQNSEQEDPKTMDCRYNSFTSPPPRDFSICCNNSGSVVELGSSYNVQIPAKAPGIALSSLSNVAAIDSTTEAEEKEEIGIQPSCKQRSVRRRCLTFEVGGTDNRIPLRDSTNDLPLVFTSINKAPNPEECLVSTKQETDEIPPIPPRTIGLHLNGLMNPSASSDGNKFSYKDGEFSTPVPTKRVSVSYDNKISEEATERSMEGTCFEELGKCKRCRCRKSKCLKLYCDCFAAGLYCVEPCACENCFNKPIHEEIVMKTRRDIEARNPVAFAPKVVSTSDYATGFRDENSKTPASARHTRGCNCKKSGCLKKYCECYLMGVGCSPNCRCVGCKNFVGHTNEQFQFPCAVGTTSVVAINEQAKDHGDYFLV